MYHKNTHTHQPPELPTQLTCCIHDSLQLNGCLAAPRALTSHRTKQCIYFTLIVTSRVLAFYGALIYVYKLEPLCSYFWYGNVHKHVCNAKYYYCGMQLARKWSFVANVVSYQFDWNISIMVFVETHNKIYLK